MATKTTPRKFSVEEFYKLAEVGVLSEDDRVELLDGQIMVMSPIGESHRTVVDSLPEVFTDQRKGRYRVAVQNPLRIDGEDEPQPDLVLYHRSVIGRHPKPSETLLVIEVADASLDYHQRTKIPIYASADIRRWPSQTSEFGWTTCCLEPVAMRAWPLLRSPGFEDSNSTELAEVASAVTFALCSRSASQARHAPRGGAFPEFGQSCLLTTAFEDEDERKRQTRRA